MVKAYYATVLLFSFAWLMPCFAQISSNNEAARRRTENKPESLEKAAKDSVAPSVTQKRTFTPFRKNVSREQKKRLAPDIADLRRYELFLNQPRTGLIRLFQDLGCEENAAVVRVDEICLNAIPMSAFYSFREKEYTNDFLADLRLKNDFLIADGILVQGIMVALGDTALESVTMATEGMKFINGFVPEPKSGEALKQTKELTKGVKADGFWYRKALLAKENMTYALRTVAYRGSLWQSVQGRPFNVLEGDERIDLTVAFRVLKKDEAGNLTLLWKELARGKAPKIVFQKRRN